MVRRWLSIALAGLIPAVYLAAFLGMAWVRSRQGHTGEVYPSQIETLAIRQEPPDPLADARARGRKVYQHYCAICHGKNGDGNGFNASRLNPTPRNFTDPKFWVTTSDERLDYAIAQGGRSVGKSVLMPAWGHTLTDKQIRDVITYIRAFAGQAKAQDK